MEEDVSEVCARCWPWQYIILCSSISLMLLSFRYLHVLRRKQEIRREKTDSNIDEILKIVSRQHEMIEALVSKFAREMDQRSSQTE